jgi:hypothetical protein
MHPPEGPRRLEARKLSVPNGTVTQGRRKAVLSRVEMLPVPEL